MGIDFSIINEWLPNLSALSILQLNIDKKSGLSWEISKGVKNERL